MNRILLAIEKLDAELENYSEDTIQKLEATYDDIDLDHMITFQETRALAQANGLITLEESQVLYTLFGREIPNPDKFKLLSLAQKIVCSQIIVELSKEMIKQW